jgi:hypothetical protein
MHDYKREGSMNRVSCLVITFLVITGCKIQERKPIDAVAVEGKSKIKAVVGKEGGALRFGDEGAKLQIPENLLQEDVTISLKREKPSFDLSGKDTIASAYRISPPLTFAPGVAKLYIPIDRPLPGLPGEINLRLYHYGRLESDGPAGPSFTNTWKPYLASRFVGFHNKHKFLVFEIFETISSNSTRPPFGLLQAAFDME